jgi:hypothetical protein
MSSYGPEKAGEEYVDSRFVRPERDCGYVGGSTQVYLYLA